MKRIPSLRLVRSPVEGERALPDRDVVWAAVLLWMVSAARAAGALIRHETFGTEATLSLAAVIAIPLLSIAVRRVRPTGRPDER
ncbi:MAG: hypothetical protein ACRENE_25030 [Polyangiaceae bacterium]